MEILLTLVVLVIIVGGAFVNYNAMLDTSSLSDAAHFTVLISEQAKEKSTQNENDTTYGIFIDGTTIEDNEIALFSGTTYTPENSTLYQISDRLYINYARFYNVVGVYDNEVYFSKGRGIPSYNYAEIRIDTKNSVNNDYVLLTMNPEGKWSIDTVY